jgi:phosphatidylglycerophosphatase C
MSEDKARPVVAVFDFDGTITYVDSFIPFLREVCGRFGFWLRFVLVSPLLALHFVGVVGSTRTKEIFLKVFLGGCSAESLRQCAKAFADGRLATLVNASAMERVEWHRREGHRLILLSASPELYLDEWAKRNGFETLLGTRLELREGRVTGRLDGRNCHGAEKVERLLVELGDLSDHEIHAYGDSRSDRVLLEQIDHAGFRSFEGASRFGYRRRGVFLFLKSLF